MRPGNRDSQTRGSAAAHLCRSIALSSNGGCVPFGEVAAGLLAARIIAGRRLVRAAESFVGCGCIRARASLESRSASDADVSVRSVDASGRETATKYTSVRSMVQTIRWKHVCDDDRERHRTAPRTSAQSRKRKEPTAATTHTGPVGASPERPWGEAMPHHHNIMCHVICGATSPVLLRAATRRARRSSVITERSVSLLDPTPCWGPRHPPSGPPTLRHYIHTSTAPHGHRPDTHRPAPIARVRRIAHVPHTPRISWRYLPPGHIHSTPRTPTRRYPR
jgi:hypothetical protein